jgi:methyl-accepting chemotaxis protein
MKLTWNLKTKLILSFVLIGVIPVTAATLIAYNEASHELHVQAEGRASMIGADKAHQIENYFNLEIKTLEDLADSANIKDGVLELSAAFIELEKVSPTFGEVAELERFYRNEFLKTYQEKNSGSSYDTTGMIKGLSNATKVLQHDYLATNPNPLGKKDELEASARAVTYNKHHEKIHSDVRALLQRHALYDIFIVNLAGDVVYTVFKEVDFATNLVSGPFKDSGLGKAFRYSVKQEKGQVHVEDYAQYTPSYEAPASFLSTPIVSRGKTLGVLVFQLPIDRISAIAGLREGLGEKGQSLIIGADGKMRADAFHMKESYNVAESFKSGSKVLFSSPALDLAKEGKKGTIDFVSYHGEKVLAYYTPVTLSDVTWYLITELNFEEVFAGVEAMKSQLIAVLLVAAFLTSLFGWFYGGSIAKTLGNVITRLSKSNDQVSSASHESAAAATELSEAATEQAASLQETMASVEEISAMVNQNSESANKAKSTVESNAKASDDGKASVSEMIKAIGEIKETNDEILNQMESSNKEFSEIVKIISNIGEKTKVINDIVFQTKLLSFNASVEAARAGEHGKGFAVVAEEVGNLAQMSGNAAREITDMLSESIKKVNDIVEQTTSKVDQLVEIGKDKISMGESTAKRCQEALELITSNAHSVSLMVSEIANASKEQSQGVQEINKAISQLDQVTQQNSAVAQQSSAQAENLSSEATELSNAVNELVSFINGKSKELGLELDIDAGKHAAAPSIKERNVLKFTDKKDSKKSGVISEQERSLMAKVTKKASGDGTPNSDHPGFEEF